MIGGNISRRLNLLWNLMRCFTKMRFLFTVKICAAKFTGKTSNLIQRFSPPRFCIEPIHFCNPLINLHRLKEIPPEKILLPDLVNLRVVLPAKRQCPHPDVAYLLAVAPHSDRIDVMQLCFPPAYRAPLIHEARPHIPRNIL